MHDWDDDRIYQRACIGLTREGHEVYLVATEPTQTPKEESVRFKWIKRRSGWRRRWFSSREAIEKATETNADVYHFHDPDLLPHVLRLKKAKPESVVIYDIHENYAGRFQNWGLPAFLGRWFRIYEKSVIKKLDGYTTVSESMGRLFLNVQTPSIVIRNSTDLTRLEQLDVKAIEPYNPPAIYTSGTHSHARHCLQTVIAMEYISSSNECQIVFAGTYADGIEKEMLDAAEEANKSHLLKLEGMLPWEENFKRTAKAYAGCVFYEDNPNNRVGIPNRLFEYMYCGIPVIATDFPELRKIVDDAQCGLLVDSENPESISKGISYLLENPFEARQMGERGRLAMESKYGYHVDLKHTIDFYTTLSNERLVLDTK